jgi:hypothetical protein
MTKKNQTKWEKDRETFLRKILIVSRALLAEGEGKLELILKIGETTYHLSPKSEIFDVSAGMKGAVQVILAHALGQVEILFRFDGSWVWWDPKIKGFPASISRFRESTKDKLFAFVNLDEEGNPIEIAIIPPETIPDSSLHVQRDENNLGKIAFYQGERLGLWRKFEKEQRESFFDSRSILDVIEDFLFVRQVREEKS